jgi:hypothetical protein
MTGRLRHSSCQANNERPLRLGRYFAIVIGAGAVGVGAWMLMLRFAFGNDWATAISVAASGFATYSVGVLALVALYNWLSCKLGWRYLWALPADIHFSLDFAIPAAVIAGIVVGWFVWQY